MHEFQIGRFVGLGGTGQCVADAALMRIGIAVLVGDLADRDALDADAHARAVHHAEHARHAGRRRALLAGLGWCGFRSKTPGDGIVEIEHAGRLRLDAHLLFDAARRNTVARAHLAVLTDQEFRHHEEVHGGEIVVDLAILVRNLGDHHVDDVVGEVVIAAGDKDLRAGHAIRAVGLFNCARFHQAQVGAAAGFGQAHRAAPFAGDHFRRDMFLHPRLAGGGERGIGGAGQARIHREGLVGAHRHFRDGHGDRHRHVRAAERCRCSKSAPAGRRIGLVGFLEPCRRAHDAVLVMRAFLVTRLVDRVQHFLAELGRVGQDVFDEIGRKVGELRQVALLVDLQQFVQNKAEIVERRAIDRHGNSGCELRSGVRRIVSHLPASRHSLFVGHCFGRG